MKNECECSGLTGDPHGVYCEGQCHCGACDDHEPGWKPEHDPTICETCQKAVTHKESNQ